MRKLTHWLQEYSPAESLDLLRTIALTHSERGGKTGQAISMLIHRGDFKSLCEFKVNYDEMSVTEALQCRQALAFFSKLEDLEIGINKEEAAYAKFLEAEEECRKTNLIFRKHARGEFQFPPRVEAALYRAQRKIARVLGVVPGFEKLGFRFGPGATTATKKREASIRAKASGVCACSEELFPAAKAVLSELPHLADSWASSTRIDEDGVEWASVPVQVHDGRLGFVPKNAKILRGTVTEPPLNTMVQLAYGDYMSSRLAAFGLDLTDQTRNQRLAREGSLTGALATLDLSSASDTIAIELVYHLLPLEWACALGRARTGHVTYDASRINSARGSTSRDERITLEKFSSMGNGYTFPLESLIFWALSCAVCEDDDTKVSVYGDDIIVPTQYYEPLVELLTAVGFQVNREKSYHKGLFRESCGADWYEGTDIRPYHQKGWVSPRTLFLLHNFYVRRGDLDRASWVKQFIHPSLMVFGPDGYGDGHLLTPNVWGWRRKKPSHAARGFAGFTFDTFAVTARTDDVEAPGEYVVPLYTIYRRPGGLVFDPGTMITQKVILKPRFKLAPTGPVLVGGDPVEVDDLEKLRFQALFRHRAHGSLATSLPIPDAKKPDGSVVKAVSLPMDDGLYKRVSIYTLE